MESSKLVCLCRRGRAEDPNAGVDSELVVNSGGIVVNISGALKSNSTTGMFTETSISRCIVPYSSKPCDK